VLLTSLGYGPCFSSALPEPLTPARVVSNLGALVQLAGARSTHGELSGRLRHELVDHERPTVGDWVAIADGARPDDRASIHHVLPRRTVLIRRAAGTRGERQAVAANVDTFAVVTSGNRDASPRRLERYLSAIAESGAAPIIVLNKVDLCSPAELEATLTRLAGAALDVPILSTSATTGDGIDGVRALISPGRTLALIGMSASSTSRRRP
jgi:ribosome biogenesis GTPase